MHSELAQARNLHWTVPVEKFLNSGQVVRWSLHRMSRTSQLDWIEIWGIWLDQHLHLFVLLLKQFIPLSIFWIVYPLQGLREQIGMWCQSRSQVPQNIPEEIAVWED